MSNLRPFGILLLLALLSFASQGYSASEHHAVVVGIDQYSDLGHKLKGAGSDAEAFAEQLRRRGIEPTVLLNEKATTAAIEQAIAQGSHSEDLLFYFAGLGSGPNTPRLLTYDSVKGLTLESLDKALLEADAKNTTVILDTSFTGLRGEKDGPSLFRSRYFEPANPRSLESLGANAAELPGLSHEKICYITASRFNEEAFEDVFDGQDRGVFSQFLCQRFESLKPIAWGSIQMEVASNVTAHLQDLQHPVFPSQYLAQAALGGGQTLTEGYGASEERPKTAQHQTLWTVFNLDNLDPSLLTLSMRPNQTQVRVEEPLVFEINVGKPGYLVVVEHSVEGTLKPIFPRDGDVATARVQKGERILVPEAGTIAFADRPGRERLKAMLFDNEDSARELLEGLDVPSAGVKTGGPTFGSVSKRLQAREIRFAPDARAVSLGGKNAPMNAPTTADLTFRVVEK